MPRLKMSRLKVFTSLLVSWLNIVVLLAWVALPQTCVGQSAPATNGNLPQTSSPGAQLPTTVQAPGAVPPSGETPTPPPAPENAPVDFERLREQARTTITDEKMLADTLAVIDQAEKQTQEAETKRTQKENRDADLLTVERRLKEAQKSLADLKDFKPETFSQDTPLEELEDQLAAFTASLDGAKRDLAKSDGAMKESIQRRGKIDAELTDLSGKLEQRKEQLATAVASSDGTVNSLAMIAELKSSVALLQANIEATQSEKALLTAESTVNLPQIQRDADAREAETLELQVTAMQPFVDTQRALDKQRRQNQAEDQLNELHPTLKPIGVLNIELADLDKSLAIKIADADAELKSLQADRDKWQEKLKQAKERVKSVGLTFSVGVWLNKLKQDLPSASTYRLKNRNRDAEINELNFKLMELTDLRNEKNTVRIGELLSVSNQTTLDLEREFLETSARDLLQEQRTEYLDPVIESQTTLFNTLLSISAGEEEIIDLIGETRRFINENIFWIRSSEPLYRHYVPNRSEWWFMSSSAWSNVLRRVMDDIQRRLVQWVFATIGLVILVYASYRLRSQSDASGSGGAAKKALNFYPTLKATFQTIATALPLPFACWFLAQRVAGVAGDDRTLLAITFSLRTFASLYLPLEMVRQICRANGLAETHFGWPTAAIAKLRRPLRMLLFIAVPAATFSAFLNGGSPGTSLDVLERYFALVAFGLLGAFFFHAMHPRRGVPSYFLARNPDGWANRLSSVWYFVLLSIPVAMTLLTIAGYHFTSIQIGFRFFQSLGLLFGIGVALSLVMRWSLIQRRRLRIEQAQAKRAAEEGSSSENTETAVIELEEESPQVLEDQMNQSRRMFQSAMAVAAIVGIWIVWSDVVPALGAFEKHPLWKSTTTFTEEQIDDEGNTTTLERDIVDPVTLPDVGLALLIIAVTFGAIRNLPGMLEFSVLRKLPLDRSIRYAITTIMSYLLALIGIMIAFGQIGLHWDKFQWMATALMFGLAFGLQEMFANFIAGIIILFERPVRVGDIVEIDGVTGVVSRIRIRATTITNWDRMDYIVPNKEFITGKVLNWTRSDEVTRIVINIGVAYGSDTELTRNLLYEVAREHPEILETPSTLATFEGFGDNTLNFVLRCFVGSCDVKLSTTHDLHVAIDNKFRDAGIEIAFPQRDLHIRTMPAELTSALSSQSRPESGRESSPEYS